MRKTKVKPPRTPRGESAKVTIANQDNQIRMLTERIVALTNRNFDLERELVMERDSVESFSDKMTATNNETIIELGKVREAYIRLSGWQDCARELLEIKPGTRIGDRVSFSDIIRRGQVNAS